MLVIFIIAFPSIFRNMEPRYQQRIIDMDFPLVDPWIESLRPTVPFVVLPTLDSASDSDAAQQLLLTQDHTSTPALTPQATISLDDQATPVPTITATPGEIPIGMAATPVPTLLPVYVSPTPDTAAFAPTWTRSISPPRFAAQNTGWKISVKCRNGITAVRRP
jgi:hypothetical protein